MIFLSISKLEISYWKFQEMEWKMQKWMINEKDKEDEGSKDTTTLC